MAFYLEPHHPRTARKLFEWCADAYGWSAAEPRIADLPGRPRTNLLGLALARELGVGPLADALQRFADAHYEPTWDRARGEFTAPPDTTTSHAARASCAAPPET